MFSVSQQHWPGSPGKKSLFRATLICVVLLTALLLGHGSYASAAQSDEDPLVRIENYLNTAVENDTFSGAVLIARDGEILLSEGYGLANRVWDIPNTPDTKFWIASLTKQFTSMSILMLQERGSLSVDDLVCQYIEDCPAEWGNITIHHLLTHTSGILSVYEMPGFEQTMMVSFSSPQRLIERFINEPLGFQPGEEWHYSDSGYIVLGRIIEVASDERFKSFLRENIFDPLGMTNTDYDPSLNVIQHLADGYTNTGQRAAYISMSNLYAAGGLYSTVEDLYRWDQALYAGEIVSQESWDAMLAAAVSYPAELGDNRYGYGLEILSESDHPSISHGGGIPGFLSSITHLTDDNVTIIILSNLEGLPPWDMARVIEDAIFDEE